MGQVCKAFTSGGGFEPAGVAAGQAFDAAATSTDDVVVMMPGGDQGVEAPAALEWVSLQDAGFVQGPETTVDGHEVQSAISSSDVNFLGAHWAGGFGQDIEHG
jgi:hypothetical protein